MKSDLDALMQKRNLDALLVVGPGQNNPDMVYLIDGPYMIDAHLIKPRGAAPVLFHRSMERDEAARAGLPTRNLDEYRLDELRKQSGGSMVDAIVARYRQMFKDVGVTSGRVAIYGQFDAGSAYTIFSALQAAMPELEIVGEMDDSLLSAVMSTKDQTEIERIRKMGKITVAVVGQTADFITSHRVRNQTVVKPDGSPLTIGDVKRKINLWLAEREADNSEGTIFAIGRDSAVPHSTGTASSPLRLGETIIFDIFPCEPGGGYYYDFTRTWCLGYAPDAALALFEDVLDVYRQVMDRFQVSQPCRIYQQLACELFKSKGHLTLADDPLTQEGFVHNLGHGLGLRVHERPSFRLNSEETERLDPGVVITVEPGLYYPEKGLGVRLEDTVWVRPDGKVEVIAEYPMELVMPMKG
jgi:Xaa-Pro aminopeptidase